MNQKVSFRNDDWKTDVNLIMNVLQMRFGRSDLIIEIIISIIQHYAPIEDSSMQKLISLKFDSYKILEMPWAHVQSSTIKRCLK